MAMGSGSAAALVVGLLCLAVSSEMADAVIYNVGGASGWTSTSSAWARGKRFKAGDVLVFKFNPTHHNMVAVSAAGYRSCTVPRGSSTYSSGNDRFTLRRGTNYFICSFPGHCNGGMKMAVTAA